MKNPPTIEASVLDTVAGGWRHRHWHHHRGSRSSVVVNNYWGAQPAPAPTSNFSLSLSSNFRF